MECFGIASTAATLARAVLASTQKTATVPHMKEAPSTTTLQAALPAWNMASLRPARSGKRAGPTMPSEIAETAGPNRVPTILPITPAATTGAKRGASGIDKQVPVTTTAA